MKDAMIKIVPHQAQHYDTAGDYADLTPRFVSYRISHMKDGAYELLVCIHELIEKYLCDEAGISTDEVTKWDLAHLDNDDPGSIPEAPYHAEHMIATRVERFCARAIGVVWKKYNEELDSLVWEAKK